MGFNSRGIALSKLVCYEMARYALLFQRESTGRQRRQDGRQQKDDDEEDEEEEEVMTCRVDQIYRSMYRSAVTCNNFAEALGLCYRALKVPEYLFTTSCCVSDEFDFHVES